MVDTANNFSTIAEMFNLPETPETPVQKSEHVIRQEVYDGELYNDIFLESEVMQETVSRGNELLGTFDLFAQDAFLSLFKYEPELLPDAEIAHRAMNNKRLMDAFFASEDFNSLRSMTQLDALASALGTEVLAEKTIQQLKKRQEEKQQSPCADNEPEPGDANGEKGSSAAGNCEQQSPDAESAAAESPADKEPGEKESSADGNATGNATGASNIPAANDGDTQFSDKEIADIAADACKDAAGEVKEVLKQIAAWGIEPGDPSLRVSFKNKRDALEKLRRSPGLKELSELVGRFRVIARNLFKKRGMDGSVSICNVTTGGDLEKVLPSEKISLANEKTKMDFLRRYHQKELLQYKSKELPAGRGTLIVCCDISGSMRGEPEKWAKAVGLALAEIAQRQKRSFACILFNSSIVGTWVIPKGIWNPSAIIEIAEVAPSGGTNFDLPLLKAYELICGSKFNKADVIFITDGQCQVDDGFLQTLSQAKSRKGFMIFTVLINIGNKASSGTVRSFSDEVITVSSLAQLDDGTALNLFSKVQQRG